MPVYIVHTLSTLQLALVISCELHLYDRAKTLLPSLIEERYLYSIKHVRNCMKIFDDLVKASNWKVAISSAFYVDTDEIRNVEEVGDIC